MERPIGYKVPTFIEEAGKKQNEKTVTAKEAMAEWLRWIAYVNKLEKDVKLCREVLNEAIEIIKSLENKDE